MSSNSATLPGLNLPATQDLINNLEKFKKGFINYLQIKLDTGMYIKGSAKFFGGSTWSFGESTWFFVVSARILVKVPILPVPVFLFGDAAGTYVSTYDT